MIKENPRSLCQTCSYCHEIVNDNDEVVRHCGRTENLRVRFDVKSCNKYEKVGRLSVYDMSKIAWILETNKKEVGFLPPGKRKREKKDDDLYDELYIPSVRED